jgi:hypothetical protein
MELIENKRGPEVSGLQAHPPNFLVKRMPFEGRRGYLTNDLTSFLEGIKKEKATR